MKSKHKAVESSNLTRNNHYVPQWYQKGFTEDGQQLHYLDLAPEEKILENGRKIKFNERKKLPFSKCFCEVDLYTTYFGNALSDEIEKEFFGKIDDSGAKAIRAFIGEDAVQQHERFKDFFLYIDSQKTRTPKGLSWLKEYFSGIGQEDLMSEMKELQNMHCVMWMEGTREIVSAKDSQIKFIVSDDPVTIYNYACPPSSQHCEYPYDPSISLNASQTLFPLNQDYCLILTNYEYAANADSIDPMRKRTNARKFGETLTRTDAWHRERKLTDQDVRKINFVIKKRARRFIAAAKEEWLYPDHDNSIVWEDIKEILLFPKNKIYKFGGELIAGFENGDTYYQDAFGRSEQGEELKKKKTNKEPSPNDCCPCGQGKRYKKCCKYKDVEARPSWDEYSIRERNLMFYHTVQDLLGLSKNKSWEDVRTEINDDQVRSIYKLYGDLWPTHTDLISLLPKADGVCRTVYVGVVDPRTIGNYATSLALYFDEVIIQNPFNHPKSLSLEYNPLQNPSLYKQEVIKNFLILEELYPFIMAGIINFIPDITVFSQEFRTQLQSLAKKRQLPDKKAIDEDGKLFSKLIQDDSERNFLSMPEGVMRCKIRETFPDESELFINNAFDSFQKKRRQDPMALLQDNIFENGGQITFSNLIPGPEFAVFIAKVTGSIIFTDSLVRFCQMTGGIRENELTVQDNNFVERVELLNYPFYSDSETVFFLRKEGYACKAQKAWKDILNFLVSNERESIETFENLYNALVLETQSLSKTLLEDSKIIKNINIDYSFDAKFQFDFSIKSVTNNDVMRLCLICGIEKPSNELPIVIFGK